MKRSIWIVLTTLVLDQALKIWVKTHMYLSQEYQVFDWFYIHFTENNAWPLAWNSVAIGACWPQFIPHCFRCIYGFFLLKLIRKNADKVLIVSLSLVLAGALGNIIDGTLYGVLFSESYRELATFLPEAGAMRHCFLVRL